MLSSYLPKLLTGQDLNFKESLHLFDAFFSGKLSLPLCKTTLVLLARKGAAVDEIKGCVQTLRKYEPPTRSNLSGLLDTCGTGGDQSASINISTLAAITAAGAGVKVAKHGNRAFTSKCGSSDLLESFGVRVEASAKTMIRSIQKNNLGYFHAPSHHPVISKFHTLRKKLKIKTIFNLLGPLTNPLDLDFKLVGTSDLNSFKRYAEILKKMPLKRVLVVHNPGEGMDEISTCSPTEAALIQRGKIHFFKIDPSKLGFRKTNPNALRISSVADSRVKALAVLSGTDRGSAKDAVTLNAGAAIWIAGKSRSLAEGIKLAQLSIESGAALQALRQLARNSRAH